MPLNEHFPRPGETDPYIFNLLCFCSLVYFDNVRVNSDQKRIFLEGPCPFYVNHGKPLWGVQSFPPLGNLLLYRTKYCPISQTLQRETFPSFVNALSHIFPFFNRHKANLPEMPTLLFSLGWNFKKISTTLLPFCSTQLRKL